MRRSPGKRNGSVSTVLAGLIAAATIGGPAKGEIVLSKVIVDLQPEQQPYDDIEVWNDGSERMYIVAEPAEILDPGLPQERRVPANDPAASGLLVAPQRMVLEPGQRRVVRVSAVAPRGDRDRVYRVAIKPVSGELSAEQSALKVFVGYDTLVIYRPAKIVGAIEASREGLRLTMTNKSNTALEVFGGKQCNASGIDCRQLATARLYAGAILEQALPFETPVEYNVSNGGKAILARY